MTVPDGFWSYVHDDDDAEGGRITQLARDVAAQFQLLTGEKINLFLDRDNLVWGDDWRPKIDDSLASVAFFIPVITPRFFKSAECRRELNFFARNAEKLGIKELVLPILYVDFPALHDDPPKEDIVALVKRFQWEDWTDLKYADRESGEYRRAVSKLAARLVAANESAEQASAQGKVVAALESNDDPEEPGSLDRLAVMESSLPSLRDTIIEIGRTIEGIGEAMQEATNDIDTKSAGNSPLAVRLTIARNLAQRLAEPADRIRDLGNGFASNLHDVDEGVRIIIARAPIEVEESPESKPNFEEFFTSLRGMVEQSEIGMASVQRLIDTLSPIEKTSRDLRPPLRTLREGLTLLVEGLSVMREWIALIDATNLG
jgi:hypothetical protein